jgi:hypothetical protein
MTLEQFKQKLATVSEVTFLKPDGTSIPKHFHITEVGQINKRFIDCGGTVRDENVIAMQLWESIDFWHRLEPKTLNAIIDLSEEKLNIGNHEVEIEYQSDTIGKYGVAFENGVFKLTTTKTACLALDKCGIPTLESVKEKVQACCTPGGGCC